MREETKPALLPAFFGMKCPNCRKGRVFVNKSVFPLGKCVAMVEHCAVCGHKMVNESNNGGGINYALTVCIFFLNILWVLAYFRLVLQGQ